MRYKMLKVIVYLSLWTLLLKKLACAVYQSMVVYAAYIFIRSK